MNEQQIGTPSGTALPLRTSAHTETPDSPLLAAFNAMAQHVALIDPAGTITFVNSAWMEFARANTPMSQPLPDFVGSNYLAALEGSRAEDECSRRAFYGITAVLRGQRPSFRLEYPCHGNDSERWFVMDVKPLAGGGAVVSHTDISRLVQQRHEIEELAHHDALTGLANRHFFTVQAEAALRAAERYGRSLRLLVLDLDGFKPINDRFGHSAGDYVLVKIAHRLREAARSSDLVARFGGDEFVVLAEATPDDHSLEERLRRAVAEPLRIDREEVRVSASIGHADFPVDGSDLAALFTLADARMYAQKHGCAERRHDGRYAAVLSPVGDVAA